MSRISYSLDPALVGPWVCARIPGCAYVPGQFQAIGKLLDGALRGGILYENFSGTNLYVHTAGEGNWLDRRLLWMAADYPFNQLQVSRVTATVRSTNPRSKRLIEHLGFQFETSLAGACPGGDLLFYVMWKDACRWLTKVKHVNRISPTSP